MAENNSLDTKILIVDDDPNVRDFLKLFLKFKGLPRCPLRGQRPGRLSNCEKRGYNIAPPGYNASGFKWEEVLRQVKEMKADVSVIMITGYPDEEKARELLKQGAYDYIVKPFDLNYLELSVLSKIALAV